MTPATHTIEITLPIWDADGHVLGTRREKRLCFCQVGDWAVTQGDDTLGTAPFNVTHVPTGKRTSVLGYETVESARRYADAFAVVFSGIDPGKRVHDDAEQEERRRLGLLRQVREVAERELSGGDTQADGAWDREGS